MAFSVLCCSVCLVLCADETPYRWPLDLPPELTSSFAEYRPGRFHAGIDLRTGGLGRPVYAAANGYVSRLRCSPFGYGKAVYLQLETGLTAVYGHLDDFSPELRDYVRRAQHRAKSYTVDLQVEPGLFRVQKGQLVAKSGQTGTGAPHLHYELRDNREWPVNPRLYGITWPDGDRPIIKQMLVAPDGPDSRVNQDIVPVVLDVRAAGTGQYTCAPVRASGRIGFAVNGVDPGSGGAYKLGPYTLVARAGEQEIFRVQCDAYSYDNTGDGVVAFHPFFLKEGHLQLLWRWTGNDSELYGHTRGAGWWEVPQGKTEVVVEMTDFHENKATLTIPIEYAAPAAPPVKASAAAQGKGEVGAECLGEYLVITADFTANEPEAPEGLVESDENIVPVPFLRVSERRFRASYKPTASGRNTLRVTHPRLAKPFAKTFAAFVRGAGATVGLGEAAVSAASGSAYGVLFVGVERMENAGPKAAGLRRAGPVYRCWPEEMPIDAPVRISLPLPEGLNAGKSAVYRASGNSWSREGGELANGRATFSTRRLGLFGFLEDTTPPAVSDVAPSDGATPASRRPEIKAAISDRGSGIRDYEVSCGDHWLLTAYDPEHERISWEQDEDLPAGEQEVVIRVTDNAGNETRVARSVTVPEQ